MGKDKRKNIGKDGKEMERLLGPKKPPEMTFPSPMIGKIYTSRTCFGFIFFPF
jgi:hypothetical protein